MVETVWRIGKSPAEKEALTIPNVTCDRVEALGNDLARLPLSFAESGGTKWFPTAPRGFEVTLTVPTSFVSEHIDRSGPFYLWMTIRDGANVLTEWCNQFLIVRRQDSLDDDGEALVSISFQSLYKDEFSTIEELLATAEQRPSGDFVNANCGCLGQHDGLRDWFRRVRRRAPYIFASSTIEGSERQSGGQVTLRPPRFVVSRKTRDGRTDWQCSCGAWTEVEPSDRGYAKMTPLEFHDSRSAHDHVRRLRNGVPQNWELIVAVSSVVSGAAFVIGEIVIPLFSSCG